MNERHAAQVGKLGDRSLFPDLTWKVYLNHAAIAAASSPVVDATRAIVDDYARRGFAAFFDWHAERASLRDKLGRLVGGSADDIAFVTSTTDGIIDLALCYPWKRGDRVVVYEGEFPANVTPWQRAAELFGLELVMLPLADFAEDDEGGLARLESELARGVRLVAVSAVEFQTGLRMPLAGMASRCHARGAELSVDGVQACGIVPIDVGALGIDYLACGSHKWLMGLEGAGFLFVRRERVGALVPRVAGWLSHEDGLAFLSSGAGYLRYDRPIRQRVDFLEGHNMSSVSLAALDASVGLLLSIGVAAIADHVHHYLDALEQGLVARGFRSMRARARHRRSGILSVLPPPEAPAAVTVMALQRELARRSVSTSTPDGLLRFSPHWPNDPSEVPLVLDAIDESVASLGG
jgi:selenocysteine lyase/cysteine desulfurase